MTASYSSYSFRRQSWGLLSFFCVVLMLVGAQPTHAQNGSENTAQLKKQLQQSYKSGAKAGNQGQYETAVSHFEEAIQYAQKLELSDIVRKIENNLVSSLKSAGSTDLKQENYEDALSHFEKVLEYTESDAGVYHNRGIALLNLDRTEEGLSSLQRAIEVGNETGNTRVANTATERIRDEFKSRASQALNAQNPTNTQISTALEALDQMEQYVEPDPMAKYYRARALFERGDFQQALQTSREGLEMHQGSRSDAAKYYFVIAESEMRLGNTAQACQTFQNASYGDYRERAQHYLKNECE